MKVMRQPNVFGSFTECSLEHRVNILSNSHPAAKTLPKLYF